MSHPTKKASPAYSFSGKRSPPKDREVPGPGQYSIVEKRSIATAGFGVGERAKLLNNVETPGPGSYSFDSGHKEGPKYSIAVNTQPSNAFKVGGPLGPGRYNPRDVNKECNISYSFAQRDPRKHVENFPGPGAYDLRSSLSQQGIRLATAQRASRYDTIVPGPGAYQRTNHSEGPSFGFGSERKVSSIFRRYNTPGPGTYASTSSLVKNGSFMTPRRPDISPQRSRGVPGPGAYAPQNLKKSSSGFSLGRAKRAEFCNRNGVPGPGNYSFQQQRPGTGTNFGSSKRPSINPINANPGPGSYKVPEKIIEGPGVSIAGKIPKKEIDTAPGPGAYDPKVEEEVRMPNIKFGSSVRGKLSPSAVPGPGMYPIEKKTEGPQFSFGTEKRVKDKKPDHDAFFYNIPSTVGNTAK